MEEGYRVPKIEEFVEGFTYEQSYALVIGTLAHRPAGDLDHWTKITIIPEDLADPDFMRYIKISIDLKLIRTKL